jgi:hypothetical protein
MAHAALNEGLDMPSVGRAILLAVLVLPAALITGCWIEDSIQTDTFYQKHPLLKEIDQTVSGVDPWKSNPLAIRRSVILKRVPLGTSRLEAVRLLSLEGFHCQRWNNPARRDAHDCFLLQQQPAPFGTITTGRRLIQLDFDDDETLVDANEFPLK